MSEQNDPHIVPVENQQELTRVAQAMYALDGEDYMRMSLWFITFWRNSAMRALAETPSEEWDYDEPRQAVEEGARRLSFAVAHAEAALNAMQVEPIFFAPSGEGA